MGKTLLVIKLADQRKKVIKHQLEMSSLFVCDLYFLPHSPDLGLG